jgi:[ribosomal protein S5]-alanine N-acetyltransferase
MQELATDRLNIRRFKPDDWRDLYDYLSDPKVVTFEPYPVFTKEQCQQEAMRRSNQECFWAVCLKSTGKLVGNVFFEQTEPKVFLNWELGYVLNSQYQRKGYATESCRRVLDYGFQTLRTRRVIALCNVLNTASWKLLADLGFRREGHFFKQSYFKCDEFGNPIWQDVYQYAILSDEWPNAKKDQLL